MIRQRRPPASLPAGGGITARSTGSVDDGPALELSGVSLSFPRAGAEPLSIFTDLDLSLSAGQLHCVSGRSGSGKTSVLRIAAALLAPTGGVVRWSGARVDQHSAVELMHARRGQLSYVDQEATAIEQLTAIDNVLLPAVPIGITRDTVTRAGDLLELVGLADRARAGAATLSGGERQRLALARGLLLGPPLLIVDEPTSSLDRASADTVISALTEICRDHAAVLVASHDPALVTSATSTTSLD